MIRIGRRGIVVAAALAASSACETKPRVEPDVEPTAVPSGPAARALAPPALTATSTAPATENGAPRTASGAACPPRSLIGTVSLAADGRALLTACAGRSQVCGTDGEPREHGVDVWELPAGRIARTLDAGMANVTSLTWGRGGWLATFAEPSTGAAEVHLYDAATWTLRANVEAYCVGGREFSPSGAALAFAFADGRIRVVSTKSFGVTKRPDAEAHIGGDYGVGVAFSKDEQTLFVEDESAGVQALSASTLRRTFQGPEPGREGPLEADATPAMLDRATSAAFSPDWSRLAYCDARGALVVRESNLRVKHEVEPARADDPCGVLTWIDTSRLAVARKQGEIAIWDVKKRARIRVLRAASGATDAASTLVDPAAKTLAARDVDGLVSLWDLDGDSAKPRLSFRMQVGGRLSWSPAGTHLAGLFDDHVTVWDAATGDVAATLQLAAADEVGRELVWSADGRFVVVSDGAAHFVRVSDGASVRLSVFVRDGHREAVAASKAAFDGPADLLPCASSGATRAAPTLVADLLAGRPVP